MSLPEESGELVDSYKLYLGKVVGNYLLISRGCRAVTATSISAITQCKDKRKQASRRCVIFLVSFLPLDGAWI
jgi:hypothetical protein